jgi:hypothetical protein
VVEDTENFIDTVGLLLLIVIMEVIDIEVTLANRLGVVKAGSIFEFDDEVNVMVILESLDCSVDEVASLNRDELLIKGTATEVFVISGIDVVDNETATKELFTGDKLKDEVEFKDS